MNREPQQCLHSPASVAARRPGGLDTIAEGCGLASLQQPDSSGLLRCQHPGVENGKGHLATVDGWVVGQQAGGTLLRGRSQVPQTPFQA